MAVTKNPSTIIYWNDLENDEHLRTCSLAAKGLWDHHMLPIAARSDEPGVVLLGKHPSRMDGDLPALLARATGEAPDVIASLLRELVDSGAASIDGQGRVYNRRMVREEARRQQLAAAGRKGGKAPRKPKADPKQTPQQNGNIDGSTDGSKEGSTAEAVNHGDETINGGNTEAQDQQHPEPTEIKTEPSSSLHVFPTSHTPASSTSAAASDAGAREAPAKPEAAAAADDDLVIPAFLRRSTAPITQADVDEAWRSWKTVAYGLRIRDADFLNPERRAAFAERLTECAKADSHGDWRPRWAVAMAELRDADWLRDDADPSKPKHFVSLGWALKPEIFTRLMEGRYAERHDPKPRARDDLDANLQALAEFGREGAG